MDAVAGEFRRRGGRVAEPVPAPRDAILRVHSEGFLQALESAAGRAVMLDPDTFTSSGSWEITQLAAGAACGAVDAVLEGPSTRVAALVRPPGHHSNRDLARGFCLVNNAAVAAAHALARGLARVAIVDFDVHHGNGTQEIFDVPPRVLYVSSHQWPFYPGTGAADEVGSGDGRGFTANCPLPGGQGDADYGAVFHDLFLPLAQAFLPFVRLPLKSVSTVAAVNDTLLANNADSVTVYGIDRRKPPAPPSQAGQPSSRTP